MPLYRQQSSIFTRRARMARVEFCQAVAGPLSFRFFRQISTLGTLFCALLLPEGGMSRAFAECPDRRHWRDHGSQSRDDASRREINRIGRTLAKRRTSGRAGAQGRKRQITLRDKGAPSLVCGNSFDPAALGRPVGHDGGRHRRGHTCSFTLIATAARPEGAGADKLPREPPTCRVESSPAGSLRSCGDGTARPCGSRRRSPDDGSE